MISRQNARCGQVLVFLSQRLGHPAAVDNLVICQNARCVQVLVFTPILSKTQIATFVKK